MRRWLTTVGAITLVMGVAACEEAPGDSADSAPVLVPGDPGEPASPASTEQLEAAGATSYNEADVEYIHMMIPHHEQALEMTELAPERAERDAVERIARRIAAVQEPEIESMTAWLERHDLDTGAEGSVDHTDMPGMASAAELDALRDAEGAEFDAMFVDLMSAHHEGAVTMAEDVLADGENILIRQMATDLMAEQRTEINRMRDVLGD